MNQPPYGTTLIVTLAVIIVVFFVLATLWG
jgi:hypothetical protein